MLKQVDSRLLEGLVIFHQVITHGSFTSAAEITGHSTSYISKEINKLESRLGIRLIHRTTRRLSLTPEGEYYYQQCQSVIETALEAEAAISGEDAKPRGRLKISCPIAFGVNELSPIIIKYQNAYPEVEFDIELDDRHVDVIGEGYDIVIRSSRSQIDSSLISRRLRSSNLVTLASPNYLKHHGTPLHPMELTEHKTLCYANNKHPKVWDYYDEKTELIRVEVCGSVVTNSPDLELALCIAGQGITRMPIQIAQQAIIDGKLKVLFDEFPALTTDVCLVYPSRKHMSAKVRQFIEMVLDELGE